MDKMNRRIVSAICRGYYERKRRIDKQASDPAVLDEYKRLNTAIDRAMFILPDEYVQGIIKKAVTTGAGFDRIGEAYLGRRQYYQYKGKVMTHIAQTLNLE